MMRGKLIICMAATLVGAQQVGVIEAVTNTSEIIVNEARTTVSIPDLALRKAINKALGKGEVTTTVTQAEMLTLSGLTATNLGITNLTGLESARNIRSINVNNNSIKDITPLVGLPILNSLDIAYNPISDFSQLAKMKPLKYLSLLSTGITDAELSYISGLTNLETLSLTYNKGVTNLSALKNLTNLTSLEAYSTGITDISALSGLTKLTSLNIGLNGLKDISVVKNFPNLVTLRASDNPIEDYSSLASLTKLNRLELLRNGITDISFLKKLTTLTYLRLDGNLVSDLTPLSNLTKLTTLYLGSNRIVDISPISKLSVKPTVTNNFIPGQANQYSFSPSVTSVAVEAGEEYTISLNWFLNGVATDAPTDKLFEATAKVNSGPFSVLSVDGNKVKVRASTLGTSTVTIEPVPGLTQNVKLTADILDEIYMPDPNLKKEINRLLGQSATHKIGAKQMLTLSETLDLSGLNIKDLTGLEYALNTKKLFLGENDITDVSPLHSLTKLEVLDLSSNNISNIEPLYSLLRLEELNLGRNRVSDFSPLGGLPSLIRLDISENNLSRLTGFDRLDFLIFLKADSNNIKDLSPLYELPELTSISFRDNQIEKIDSALVDTVGVMHLEGNKIIDVSALLGTPYYDSEFYLQDNLISDVETIKQLEEALGRFGTLKVEDNFLEGYPSQYTFSFRENPLTMNTTNSKTGAIEWYYSGNLLTTLPAKIEEQTSKGGVLEGDFKLDEITDSTFTISALKSNKTGLFEYEPIPGYKKTLNLQSEPEFHLLLGNQSMDLGENKVGSDGIAIFPTIEVWNDFENTTWDVKMYVDDTEIERYFEEFAVKMDNSVFPITAEGVAIFKGNGVGLQSINPTLKYKINSQYSISNQKDSFQVGVIVKAILVEGP